MKYIGIKEFNDNIKELARQIDEYKDKYSALYPILRGGAPIAIALSKELDLPITDKIVDRTTLLIDDLVDSGNTYSKYIMNHLAVFHIKKNTPIQYRPEYFISEEDDWIEYWWEKNEAPAEDAVIRLIQMIGEDPVREGLLETPKRVIKAYEYLFSGYKQNINDIIKVFDSEQYDQIVLLKDIEFYSMCEHHMLPFFGKAHIAYIPQGKVIGVSKLARVLDVFARRLQIQERLCDQVTGALMEYLKPVGAACIIEANHLCMRMRGVEKQNSIMTTSSLKGIFLKSLAARDELMKLIKQ